MGTLKIGAKMYHLGQTSNLLDMILSVTFGAKMYQKWVSPMEQVWGVWMKIVVNNVYQRKSISKFKVGIVIALFVIILVVVFWRLYYERTQTSPVSSFVEFIGISRWFEKDESEVVGAEESVNVGGESSDDNSGGWFAGIFGSRR